MGLGNPGPVYEGTRHNLGFMVMAELVQRLQPEKRGKRYNALYFATKLQGEEVVLVEPLAFMNRSGGPVRAWLQTLQLPASRLIVVHDDLDLPSGRLKVVAGGGHGGHKGVRSIQEELQTSDFVRVKLGIGHPGGGVDPTDYVLAPFEEDEKETAMDVVERGADAVEVIMGQGLEVAQNRFNRRPEG
ncbi:MAG: aminoacyl-tRNA hydrolase [candidate division NC10 bacterium]|nr:aminoacyl-tRNA hydrolase [candidate division NC10 bacterium]